MKKFFILLLLCTISNIVFAQKLSSDIIKPKKDIDISNNTMMQAMYDSFLPAFYQGMERQAIANQMDPKKVKLYINALKKRTNKQSLINETYPCLSKIPLEKLETEGMNCFLIWAKKNVYEQNADLLNILK